MRKPLVYLAGAIAGLIGYDATDWREKATVLLLLRDIEPLNPMRAKDALAGGTRISTDFLDYADKGPFYTSRGIMTRDFTDVRRSDALLVNLLGLEKPSLGTVMELAWAYCLQKPAVVCIEPSGNPHDGHPMIHEAIGFRVSSLDEGVDAVATILNR